MKTQLGIDYSGALGRTDTSKAPNFNAVKKAGTEFVILRASYGGSKDSALQRDWQKLKSFVRGAYMLPVMTKDRSPEDQVDTFAEALTQAGGLLPGVDLPPVLDIEFPKGIKATGMTRLQCIDWIERTKNELVKAFGCQPILYTSARVWDGEDEDSLNADQVPTPEMVDCPLWLARYPYKVKITAHYKEEEREGIKLPAVPKQLGDSTDVWINQYQGDATGFPGINRTVDLNRYFVLSQKLAVKGSERVKWVQRKLGLKTDGDWGPKTEIALRHLQTDQHLDVDGVVGVRTFCALAWK